MEVEAECEALKKALKDKGDTLINLVLSKSRNDRFQIRQAYKSIYGKDLLEDIDSALMGNFKKAVIDLFRTPQERDAYHLYKAMKGIGTNDETVIEIICSRTNLELKRIIDEYKQLYNEDLEKRISSETNGSFRNILVSLLQCKRSENSIPNDEDCKKLAEALYKAGEGKLGTDKETFNKVFASASPPELFSINNYYSQISSRTLKQAVEKEFSGSTKNALITILEFTLSAPNYFAGRINKAVKGLGTNDKMLIRNLCAREGVDMRQIRESYKNLFGKDMVEDIKGDTSGHYQKLLMSLASGE